MQQSVLGCEDLTELVFSWIVGGASTGTGGGLAGGALLRKGAAGVAGGGCKGGGDVGLFDGTTGGEAEDLAYQVSSGGCQHLDS